MPVIENTTIEPRYINGVLRTYKITPNEGYLIHCLDPESEAEDRTLPTFTPSMVSVGYNYDFENIVPYNFVYTDENGMTVSVPVNKVGRFGLYAIPANLVPENEIYGGGDNNEVM